MITVEMGQLGHLIIIMAIPLYILGPSKMGYWVKGLDMDAGMEER